MTQLKHKITSWGHESWVGPDGVHFSDYGCLEEAARTAPHDCDVPGCPGPVNKRKLEAFEQLLAAALEVHAYDTNDPKAVEQAHAAIAKATRIQKEETS